jgi:hypothetical protein
MTSSNTFNVGAPTFGVRFTLTKEGERSSRFYGVSPAGAVPFWNDAKIKSPMILKTISLQKPSSNTLNVGAPTFSPTFACWGGFTPPSSRSPVVADLKVGHYVYQHGTRPAVSR